MKKIYMIVCGVFFLLIFISIPGLWSFILNNWPYVVILLGVIVLLSIYRKRLYIFFTAINSSLDFKKLYERMPSKAAALIKKVSKMDDFNLIEDVLRFLIRCPKVSFSKIEEGKLFAKYFSLLEKNSSFKVDTCLLVIHFYLSEFDSVKRNLYLMEEVSKIIRMLSSKELSMSYKPLEFLYSKLYSTISKDPRSKLGFKDRQKTPKVEKVLNQIKSGDLMAFISDESSGYCGKILERVDILKGFIENVRMRSRYVQIFQSFEDSQSVWWHSELIHRIFTRLSGLIQNINEESDFKLALIKKYEEFCIHFEKFNDKELNEVIMKKRESLKESF